MKRPFSLLFTLHPVSNVLIAILPHVGSFAILAVALVSSYNIIKYNTCSELKSRGRREDGVDVNRTTISVSISEGKVSLPFFNASNEFSYVNATVFVFLSSSAMRELLFVNFSLILPSTVVHLIFYLP